MNIKTPPNLFRSLAQVADCVDVFEKKLARIKDLFQPIVQHFNCSMSDRQFLIFDEFGDAAGYSIELGFFDDLSDENLSILKEAQGHYFVIPEQLKDDIYESIKISFSSKGLVTISHDGWGLSNPEEQKYSFETDHLSAEEVVAKVLLHMVHNGADYLMNGAEDLLRQIKPSDKHKKQKGLTP